MDNNYIPPLIVLGAEPLEKVNLDNFFAEENNPLFNLLKNPPYLRYSGWNLLTLDWPKIRDGKSWEVKNGDRKTVRLYKDGSLIAIAYADDSFLGWGRDHDKFLLFPQLNSLAVIEYIYEFVELYRKLLENFPTLKKVRLEIGLRNVDKWEGKKLCLNPVEVTALFYYSERNPTDRSPLTKDFLEKLDVDIAKDIYDSRYIAFKLVSEFFLQFGISPDKIPYTKKDSDGIGYIDIEKIVSGK